MDAGEGDSEGDSEDAGALRHRGTVLVFGVPDEDVYPVPFTALFRKCLVLVAGVQPEWGPWLRRAEDHLAAHPDLAALVTDVVPVGRAQDAFEAAFGPGARGKVLISAAEWGAPARAPLSGSPATQPFWDAAARGELALQRCRGCRRFVHPPRPVCPACGGVSSAFEAVSGRGTVETFSVVHRTFAPGFADRVPYVMAWVALPEQEGLRVFTNVVGPGHLDVGIGRAVEVTFEDRPGVGTVPCFRLAGGPADGGA